MKYKTLINKLIELGLNPDDEVKLEMWVDDQEDDLNFKRFLFDIKYIEQNYEKSFNDSDMGYPLEETVIGFNIKSCKKYNEIISYAKIIGNQRIHLKKPEYGCVKESFITHKKTNLFKELKQLKEGATNEKANLNRS